MISRKSVWAGRIISGVAVLFLLFDAVTKIMKVAPVLSASAQLGYPIGLIPVIGVVLLVCTAIYVIPSTSILGAVLLTGYLGGAVASQLRVGNPLFGETLFPIYFSFLIWGGLFLRDRRVRLLLPSHSGAAQPETSIASVLRRMRRTDDSPVPVTYSNMNRPT